jgi:hypothetical protein
VIELLPVPCLQAYQFEGSYRGWGAVFDGRCVVIELLPLQRKHTSRKVEGSKG